MIADVAMLLPVSILVGLIGLVVMSTHGPLARIEMSEEHVTVLPRGVNRLWAIRSSVRVPRTTIAQVNLDVPRGQAPSGFRAPGTAIPGIVQAGTYRRRGEKFFWLVGRATTVTVVETNGGEFRALVLQLDDADAEALRQLSPVAGR